MSRHEVIGFEPGGGPVDPVGCRALWCAVIEEHVRIACSPRRADTVAEISAARSWFGTSSFHAVCALAGVDGDAVAERVQADMDAMRRGEPGRAKVNDPREVRVGELRFPSVAAAGRALGFEKSVVSRALARGAGETYARLMDAARAYAAEGGE